MFKRACIMKLLIFYCSLNSPVSPSMHKKLNDLENFRCLLGETIRNFSVVTSSNICVLHETSLNYEKVKNRLTI